jgi:hypothetical protein
MGTDNSQTTKAMKGSDALKGMTGSLPVDLCGVDAASYTKVDTLVDIK